MNVGNVDLELIVILDIHTFRYSRPSLKVLLWVPFVMITVGLIPHVDTLSAHDTVIDFLMHIYICCRAVPQASTQEFHSSRVQNTSPHDLHTPSLLPHSYYTDPRVQGCLEPVLLFLANIYDISLFILSANGSLFSLLKLTSNKTITSNLEFRNV